MKAQNNIHYYEKSTIWDQVLQTYQSNLIHAFKHYWPKKVSSVLDVGCGDGKITHALANAFPDVKFHAYDQAQEVLRRLEVPYSQGNATSLPFKDSSFDLVMSTDLMEHLSDQDEQKAISELFRVSRNWVFITVPYKENLLESTAKCSRCQNLYHINWHQRSYDLNTIARKRDPDFEFCGAILSGDAKNHRLKEEIKYRRNVIGEWASWEWAQCPHCKCPGEKAKVLNPLHSKGVKSIVNDIYNDKNVSNFDFSHSEIISIFSKNDVLLQGNNILETTPKRVRSAFIDMKDVIPVKNLLPFPLNATCVMAQDGNFLVQFPAFQKSLEKCVIKFNLKSSNIDEEKIKSILSVESDGEIIPYDISIEEGLIFIKKPIEIGYYGLLLRFPPDLKFNSLELLNSPEILFLSPLKKEQTEYCRLNENIILQVPREMFLPIPPLCNLNRAKGKKILMLCHDQNLDRRIVAQARSLKKEGAEVRIIAISHTAEETEEELEEGISVFRVGTGQIIPQNAAYKKFIKRSLSINLLKFASINTINKLSKINVFLYKIHLFCLFFNRNFLDPLCFTQAFYEAGKKFSDSDLIEVHDLPTLEAGVKLANNFNVPIVYDAHELYPEQCNFSFKQKMICKKMEKSLISKVQQVITVNESIAREMMERYQIRKPRVILNSVEANYDIVNKNMLHKALNISPDRKILLFQGGLSPHRNLEKLVLAFKNVQAENVDLVFLGSGPIKEKLEAIAKKEGILNKRVYFHPAVPQETLLSYTASAWMGIIPYHQVDLNSYYCTPNKLFEFISMEIPIIANDVPELRRYVGDTEFGKVYPMKTAKNISYAIDDAASDIAFNHWKKNLSENKGLYSWQQQSYRYMKIMANVLSGEV